MLRDGGCLGKQRQGGKGGGSENLGPGGRERLCIDDAGALVPNETSIRHCQALRRFALTRKRAT